MYADRSVTRSTSARDGQYQVWAEVLESSVPSVKIDPIGEERPLVLAAEFDDVAEFFLDLSVGAVLRITV